MYLRRPPTEPATRKPSPGEAPSLFLVGGPKQPPLFADLSPPREVFSLPPEALAASRARLRPFLDSIPVAPTTGRINLRDVVRNAVDERRRSATTVAAYLNGQLPTPRAVVRRKNNQPSMLDGEHTYDLPRYTPKPSPLEKTLDNGSSPPAYSSAPLNTTASSLHQRQPEKIQYTENRTGVTSPNDARENFFHAVKRTEGNDAQQPMDFTTDPNRSVAGATNDYNIPSGAEGTTFSFHDGTEKPDAVTTRQYVITRTQDPNDIFTKGNAELEKTPSPSHNLRPLQKTPDFLPREGGAKLSPLQEMSLAQMVRPNTLANPRQHALHAAAQRDVQTEFLKFQRNHPRLSQRTAFIQFQRQNRHLFAPRITQHQVALSR